MLVSLSFLLGCQLVGEVVTRSAGVPLPGPVAGLALLLIVLSVFPKLVSHVRPTVSVILANLSLLFVPAGVGVIGNLDVISQDGLLLLFVLVSSTILTMLATIGTFIAARQLMTWRSS
jgi:putative effector of murein hydrolase LrgA (UPF0299 family)